MYLEVIAVLHYNNHDGVIHACLKKLVFHQSTVNGLAPSSVNSILPQSIHPRLLSCICVFSLYCDAC